MRIRRVLKLWVLVISLAPVTLFNGCTTVAITGRKQLNLIPAAEMNSMSFSQYKQFLEENPLSNDATAVNQVRTVGVRIQRAVERYFEQNGLASELDGYEWEFNVVESDQVNAWAMPGGKVVVYTGLIPVAQDDNGLAVVMGHEIAHAVAQHGNERMSQGLIAQLGGVALSQALKNKREATQQLWMTAFGAGAQFGAILPFGRLQESEADELGLVFMAMAGYDPRKAVDFWERMAVGKQGAAPPEFLSTHPSDATRIRKINEHMPKALSYYKP